MGIRRLMIEGENVEASDLRFPRAQYSLSTSNQSWKAIRLSLCEINI